MKILAKHLGLAVGP